VVNNDIVFSDWPAAIGIDNVKISRTEVPQPTALMLVALGGALLGWRLRRA
jgi:PEP-CTERM motif